MLKILIMEDNKQQAELFRKLLQELGHEAEFSLSPVEALAHLQAEPFDALITDWHVDGLDDGAAGLGLIKNVRNSNNDAIRDMKILVVSGSSIGTGQADMDRKAIEAGADLVMAKPVRLAELQAALG